MSRRDTIIVAALINAGILIILFVSALKNPGASDPIAQAPEPFVQSPMDTLVRTEPKVVIGDEVDQVLSQYTKQNSVHQALEMDISHTSSVVLPAASDVADLSQSANQNFVDDLNALAKASELASNAEENTAATPSMLEFRVKKGDVLEKIARNHQTTVQELMRVNKLSSTSLKIGQLLKIPAKSQMAKASITPSTQAVAIPEGNAKFYTVKSGDNPWTIAVKNHIKVEDLLRLNNMDEAKARKLKPGDQIRIK